MNTSQFNSLILILQVILVEITFSSSDNRVSYGNETNPTCSRYQFTCASGECIAKSEVCDGKKNCKDNSDESYTSCRKSTPLRQTTPTMRTSSSTRKANSTRHCWRSQFACGSGECIEKSKVCDGKKNCKDNSDENYTACRRSTSLRQTTPSMRTTSTTPKTNSMNTVDGICDLPSSSDHTIIVTDGYDNLMNVSSLSKVPKFSQIKIICNEGFTLSNGDQHQESTCYQKKRWNPSLKPCLNDCGVPYSAQPKIVKKVVSDSPWNVAIYRKSPNPELICSGTLISVRIVITAASCFLWQQKYYVKKNHSTTDYEVIVSKFTINYENIDSDFQKSYEIRDIIFNRPDISQARGNIAALVLRHAVEKNRFVLPACIDWSSGTNGFNAVEGTLGAFFMFGDETQDLMQDDEPQYKDVQNGTLFRADLPYSPCPEISWTINDEKFCSEEQWLPKHIFQGVGLFFRDPNNGRYFLRGISDYTYPDPLRYYFLFNETIFTDVSKHLNWLQEVHNRVKKENGNSGINRILCPPLQPRNVDITCHRGEREVKCNAEIIPGTRVEAQCKSLYIDEKGIHYQELICQEDGTWDQAILTCVPDGCGVPNRAQPELVNKAASESPWNVAIYRISEGPRLICSGTLISPKIVVTAPHCFYNGSHIINSTTDHEVVVSKYTSKYKIIDSSFQKNYEVQDIIIGKGFSSFISALVLKNLVTINQFVLPACIDWSPSIHGFQPSNDTIGKIAGWNYYNSKDLMDNQTTFDMELVPITAPCPRPLEDASQRNLFCVDYPGANTLTKGSGLVVRDPNNGRYFLSGMMAFKDPSKGSSTLLFFDISKFSDWLENINTRVERDQRIAESCPVLNTTNVDLTCYNRDSRRVKCNNELVRGTRVQIQCKPFYIEDKPLQYKELICQENRTWDKNVYKCVPECGTVRDSIPLIFDGKNKSIANSPWHVAVYRVSTHALICGGTLVTTRMIVSAAHCFFNLQGGTANNNATDYEIIVSKYTRNYYTNDTSQVKHKIHKIMVHEKFNIKTTGHYGHDIAVVILEKEVERTTFAIPACVDWKLQNGFKPVEGTLGKLVGWGIVNSTNEGGTYSDVLLSAMLPYVSYINCSATMNHLPNDQFCAGSRSGTGPGPRQGDSGGGLMFQDPQNNRYYLRGIVSQGKEHAAKGANPQMRAVFVSFTDISHHTRWLSGIRSDVEEMFS